MRLKISDLCLYLGIAISPYVWAAPAMASAAGATSSSRSAVIQEKHLKIRQGSTLAPFNQDGASLSLATSSSTLESLTDLAMLPRSAKNLQPTGLSQETTLASQTTASSPQITVRKIKVHGSTVFSSEQLTKMIQPFEGRSLSLEELREIADTITQEYLNLGYMTSRAVLPEQTIRDGLVQIQVVEGTLEQIDIVGATRIPESYIRQRIQLGTRSPLNHQKLKDQLWLLKFDPLFDNIEASLKEGSGLGGSILTVRVTEAPRIFGRAILANDTVPSIGGERSGIMLGYQNLTGRGDAIYAAYERTFTGGLNVFDFGYQVPLNPMQGVFRLRIAPSQYKITQQEFQSLEIRGQSTLYDVTIRQPFSRSPRQEWALSLGMSHRTGETLIADWLIDQSKTTVLSFGQEWFNRDSKNIWSWKSQFNFGIGLSDATDNRQPDGKFFSWAGQLERIQILNPDNTLFLKANIQLTPHALPPSQQFVMGGRNSVRGFRQNQRSADNGIRVSIENQITLQRNAAGISVVRAAPYIDAGAVWNNPDNPVPLASQNVLVGVGVGLIWEPTDKLNVRFDYGLPLLNLRNRGNNLQDAAAYFSLEYQL